MDNKDKLLVSDMDGTLFDTSESNYCAYRDAAQKLGYQMDREKFFHVFVGRNYKEFLPEFGVTSDYEMHIIHEDKKNIYANYLSYIKKNESLFGLINDLKKEYIVALATTASKKSTIDVLKFFNLDNYFDLIISQDEVTNLKPSPECYLKIMQKANIDWQSTVIFEDSDVGIKAAEASGAFYIRVSNFRLPKNEIKARDYLCLDGGGEDICSQIRFMDYYYYLLYDSGLEELKRKVKHESNPSLVSLEQLFDKLLFFNLLLAPNFVKCKYCDILKQKLIALNVL